MYIEGTITRTVHGRAVHVPFCIDTHTGTWHQWGEQTNSETAHIVQALRDTACDLP